MPNYTAKKTTAGVQYYIDTSTGKISWALPDDMVRSTNAAKMVWVESETEGWKAVEESKAPAGKKSLPLAPGLLDQPAMDDLVMLDDISEPLICHTLRRRFTEGDGSKFYTSAGTILIALNPYKYFPIYSAAHIKDYRHPGNRTLAPHVFQVASAAHTALTLEAKDQAILISGESGAGKTEATKHCLTFLAEVAGSDSAFETQVLAATPLLEAFGNAKTVRNNNSSRFGRWIEVHFDNSGFIASARIEQYLLEKSRVVHQAANERSYHVLYMLCESDEGERLGLQHPSAYRFLNGSGCYTVDGRQTEAEEYQLLLNAMEGLGFGGGDDEDEAAAEEGKGNPEIGEIFEFLAAILLLGNLTFASTAERKGEPGCKVDNPEEAARIAGLWKVSPTQLAECMSHRSLEVRGEKSQIQLRPSEALDGCAAAAKHIYGALFAHIVTRVNELLDGPRGKVVGALDIFGFEIFEQNSFEQLCINFANEKLQQLFCLHTFKQEEKLYEAEGVEHDHVAFIDNQPVLSLIEGRPTGVLMVLDDEAFIGPKGSDEGFLNNVKQLHDKSELLHVFTLQDRKNKGMPPGFSIEHYAGVVTYDTRGFLEKNKDPVSPELQDMLMASKSSLGKRLFATGGEDESAGASSKKGTNTAYGIATRRPTKRETLGGQFRTQLAKLMERLRSTDPHFIRCIKPNSEKLPGKFDAPMTLSQLKYAGVFEAVAIRKSGYPYRMSLARFNHWFKCLLLPRDNHGYKMQRSSAPASWESDDPQARARQILDATGQDFSEVQVGKTLVLYRAKEQHLLDLLRDLALSTLVPYLQRLIRGFLARECKRRCLQSAAALKSALETVRSVPDCDNAAKQHGKTIGGYAKLFAPRVREIRELRELRNAFSSWVKLERELEAALAKYTMAAAGEEEETAFIGVEGACLHAEKLRGVVKCTTFQEQLYDSARKIVDANAAARLTPLAEEALYVINRQDMEYVVEEADRVKFSNEHVEEIKYLLSLPEEKFVELQLKKAVELQDPKRKTNREIRLRDLYVQKFSRLFEPSAYPRLRSPYEWAEAKREGKVFGKLTQGRAATESLAAQMMVHVSKPIHIALTELESPEHFKLAVTCFKSMLVWARERSDPMGPSSAGQLVCLTALEHVALRAELYLQLLKQLTSNHSKEATERYWDLLALLLMCAPPGSGCEDFVHAFCLKHAPDKMKKRLIGQVHRGRYGENVVREIWPVEQLEQIAHAFFAKPMRSQSRFSAADLISAQAVATHMARLSADMGSMKLEPPIAEERVPDIS